MIIYRAVDYSGDTEQFHSLRFDDTVKWANGLLDDSDADATVLFMKLDVRLTGYKLALAILNGTGFVREHIEIGSMDQTRKLVRVRKAGK